MLFVSCIGYLFDVGDKNVGVMLRPFIKNLWSSIKLGDENVRYKLNDDFLF